jgi:hypothetical protein
MRTIQHTLTILLGVFVHQTHAQKPSSIKGEYHLQGVIETASALLLKPDSTFELFFSYGAMDRQGTGRWSYNNGKIRLNSRTKPTVDFALTASKSTGDSTTTVKIITPANQFASNFEVMLRSADGDSSGQTNSDGIFRANRKSVTKVELFFAFSPERYSTFSVNPNDNYFEFKIEPWIIEIFAENIELAVTSEGLVGQHPLLKGSSFLFSKTK